MTLANEDMLLRVVARQGRTYNHEDRSAPPDEAIPRVLAALAERGLVKQETQYGTEVYTVTSTGMQHLGLIDTRTLREGIGTGNAPSPGDRSLMVWLLEHGGVPTYYGGSTLPDSAVWHVAACGLDWDRSSSPEHDTWETFGGTFAESDHQHQGLTASVSCQCGRVERLSVKADVETLVDLIKDLIT